MEQVRNLIRQTFRDEMRKLGGDLAKFGMEIEAKVQRLKAERLRPIGVAQENEGHQRLPRDPPRLEVAISSSTSGATAPIRPWRNQTAAMSSPERAAL